MPMSQDYNADTGEYTPDYTLTPLTLQPVVTLAGESGNANAKLGNIYWSIISAGGNTTITHSGSGYDIDQCVEGTETAGRLRIYRNITPTEPLTLEFHAGINDAATGEVSVITQRVSLHTKVSSTIPVLKLDINRVHHYNPIRDAHVQTIHASLMLGRTECPASRRRFYWEVREGDAWVELGSSILHYFASESTDGTTLTIDRDLIGYGVRMRCAAEYVSEGGTLPLKQLGWLPPESAPSQEFNIQRVMRDLRLDENSGFGVEIGASSVRVDALISDNKGPIPNADEFYRVKWKVATLSSLGVTNPTFTEVARARMEDGRMIADIPTNAIDARFGMMTECVAEEIGPWMPWADEDGALLTDEDGAILLIK